MPQYKVIGLMSGSSLDGLDIAYCHFDKQGDDWQYAIISHDCIPYSKEWQDKLKSARSIDARGLCKLHTDYGRLLSQIVNQFIAKHQLNSDVDLIASHGHTIFHFPDQGFTTQIGDGAALATGTGIMVACDFRSSDIALGGQGTPIVPIGDMLLFKEYKYLLNLGGIANLSVKKDGKKIIAFDICAANQVLNHYAGQKGLDYDAEGKMAASGHLSEELLVALDQIPYYQKSAPKSLDNGFSKDVINMIDDHDLTIADKLSTYCEHVARQIVVHIEPYHPSSGERLLITGGGAFNTHLVNRIKAHLSLEVTIPSNEIVNYKEALVMALIGLLRYMNEPNVLCSVTGASRDSVGGALYHP